MDYFETELRNIAGPLCADSSYSDQICYVQLSKTTRAAIQFDSCGFSEEYPALYVSILDGTGEIDHVRLYFTDMGIPAVWDTPDSNGIFFWEHEGIAEWCGIQPTPENYRKMSNVLERYLETFQEQTATQQRQMVMQ